MTTITLYRYERENGKVTVSPVMPEDKEYTTLFRLIADDGMELVKDDIRTVCVDTEDATGWREEEAEVDE